MQSSTGPEKGFTRLILTHIQYHEFLSISQLTLYLHVLPPPPIYMAVHTGLRISAEGFSDEEAVHATGACPHLHARSGHSL